MPGVLHLVDRAVDLPPGPELAAVLARLPWAEVPNARLVEVLQARSRQLAHDQAQLFAGMAEIARATPVAGLPEDAVSRADEDAEWAEHEIAAALTWGPVTAERELEFARVLLRCLPLVFAALDRGLIDRGRAKVFCDHLDPAHCGLSEAQIRRLCERFVPLAPRLTARQLSRRLLAAIQTIDPDHHRRRYRRGLRERGVILHLDRDGTATLSGEGLPPDEATAAVARLDRLAEAARRAGHPGRLSQISADLYLGMLDGSFHGLTEAEILTRLVGAPRTEDEAAAPDAASETHAPAGTDAASESPAAAGGEGTRPHGAQPDDAGADRWQADRVATREGIEIRADLATLVGRDRRPGEIPGLGPIDAHTTRSAVARQRRGARWQFAVVDPRGHLLLAGPLRRRPRPTGAGPPPRVRGGVIELHVTLADLRRFAADPDPTSRWAGVIAEIAEAWADRHRLWRELDRNPRARFARGALALHVRVRDRTCIGPCCDRPAWRSHLDHTIDHGRGGDTVLGNIGPNCTRHHPDKDRGWKLSQPEPGHFVWVSPLGRTYRTRGEPIRPDLPEPEPAEESDQRGDPDAGTGEEPSS